jgi:hypothetical protein
MVIVEAQGRDAKDIDRRLLCFCRRQLTLFPGLLNVELHHLLQGTIRRLQLIHPVVIDIGQ